VILINLLAGLAPGEWFGSEHIGSGEDILIVLLLKGGLLGRSLGRHGGVVQQS
jgi:hypothetical protein